MSGNGRTIWLLNRATVVWMVGVVPLVGVLARTSYGQREGTASLRSSQQEKACRKARVDVDWQVAIEIGKELRAAVEDLDERGEPYPEHVVSQIADYFRHGAGSARSPSCEAEVTNRLCRQVAVSLLYKMAIADGVRSADTRSQGVELDPKLVQFTRGGAQALRLSINAFLERTCDDEDHLNETLRARLYTLAGEVYTNDSDSEASVVALSALRRRAEATAEGSTERKAARAAIAQVVPREGTKSADGRHYED